MHSGGPPRLRTGYLVGGHYRIDRLVARGSLSEVYRARAVGAGGTVAVKILMRSDREDQTQRDRRVNDFLREAAITAQLSHPNIVELIEVGHDAEIGNFIVFEYLPGRTLEQVVQQEGLFDEERARIVTLQILGALSVAHRHYVLHRDLKPNNVQLLNSASDPDHVKLFDFGIAKVLDNSLLLRKPTEVNSLVGTPIWMSPEQCRGHEINERSDLYSVGAILFYLVTGRAPFTTGSIYHVLNQVLSETPPSPSVIRESLKKPRLSKSFEKAIRIALSKDPKERFVDAHHFQAFLDRETPQDPWPIVGQGISAVNSVGDCPGIIAVRFEEDATSADAAFGRFPEAMEGCNEAVGWGMAGVVHHSADTCSVLFGGGPNNLAITLFETVSAAIRLKRFLATRLGPDAITLMIAMGNPTLGLFRSIDECSPLLEHIHDSLANVAAIGGQIGRGRIFVAPEWMPELRQNFELKRLWRDPWSPVEVSGARHSERDDFDAITITDLVVDLVYGQCDAVNMTDIEEVLFLTADPIEVLSAISDLQSSDRISIDGSRVQPNWIHGAEIPPTNLPPAKRRTVFLRLFKQLMEQQTHSDPLEIRSIAATVEAAHHLSAIRWWTKLATKLPPKRVAACLFRALRLASTRTPHEAVKPILQGLVRNAERTDMPNRAKGWLDRLAEEGSGNDLGKGKTSDP